MKRYKEIEDQLKEKEIYWVDKGNAGYAKFHPLRLVTKAELASALRDIFKIDLNHIDEGWIADSSDGKIHSPVMQDADTATLLVVSKILERETI